jgi:hypothetical protein
MHTCVSSANDKKKQKNANGFDNEGTALCFDSYNLKEITTMTANGVPFRRMHRERGHGRGRFLCRPE